MSKVINAYNLLDLISNVIEKNEINVSSMSKEIGIPRSTLYDFLYKENKSLERIDKLCEYVGIKIKIELV